MNRQARTALDHHCRLAGETLHPRFRRADGFYNIVMTVNSGYE